MANGKKMRIADRVRELIAAPVAEAGYLLWDVDFYKEGTDFNLLVTIETPGRTRPIGLEDCRTVSERIDPILDAADPIEGSYVLEVSSAGTERVLRTPQQLALFAGEAVRVSLYAPLNGKKTLEGVLLKNEGEKIFLQTSEGETVLEEGKYAKVVTVDTEGNE